MLRTYVKLNFIFCTNKTNTKEDVCLCTCKNHEKQLLQGVLNNSEKQLIRGVLNKSC